MVEALQKAVIKKLAELANLAASVTNAESMLHQASAAARHASERSSKALEARTKRLGRLSLEAAAIADEKAEASRQLLDLVADLKNKSESGALVFDPNAETDLERSIAASRAYLATIAAAIKRIEEIAAIFERMARED